MSSSTADARLSAISASVEGAASWVAVEGRDKVMDGVVGDDELGAAIALV